MKSKSQTKTTRKKPVIHRSQRDTFESAAREAGADESVENWELRLRAVAKATDPQKKSKG
jgi:hypothetical protein